MSRVGRRDTVSGAIIINVIEDVCLTQLNDGGTTLILRICERLRGIVLQNTVVDSADSLTCNNLVSYRHLEPT